MIDKILRGNLLTDILWTVFGLIGTLYYFYKEIYWIGIIFALCLFLYAAKVISRIKEQKKK
ncbi:hypothetical protein [Zeaxanthinibacter enoshimensis]|uniref:hypothetical protein n=1 Tax=Zeaxanthinibacter enoshimensis TaxID=392009 RepID=UPI003568E503